MVRPGAALLRPVALMGFMGCGKSTVGQLLAGRLGVEFVDLDERVVAQQGTTIPALFGRGEAVFRSAELTALATLVQEPPAVWALGGGTPLTEAARHMLAGAAALLVWLSVDADTIVRRLGADTGSRPLLAGGEPALRRLLAARTPQYQAAADWVVDARPPAPVVAAFVAQRLEAVGYVG